MNLFIFSSTIIRKLEIVRKWADQVKKQRFKQEFVDLE